MRVKFRAYTVREDGWPKMMSWEDIREEAFKKGDGRLINMLEGEFLDCHVMQLTGLKDCNGVEIYEDDIVQVVNLDPASNELNLEENSRWIVTYVPEMMQFILAKDVDNTDTPSVAVSSDRDMRYIDHDCVTWIKVIGNIHENPELMVLENEEWQKETYNMPHIEPLPYLIGEHTQHAERAYMPIFLNFREHPDYMLGRMDTNTPAVQDLVELLQQGMTVELCPTLQDGKVIHISVVTHTAKRFAEL